MKEKKKKESCQEQQQQKKKNAFRLRYINLSKRKLFLLGNRSSSRSNHGKEKVAMDTFFLFLSKEEESAFLAFS